MSDEMNVQLNKLDDSQALEYYNNVQANQQRAEAVNNDYVRTPDSDTYESSNKSSKRKKTLGIIIGTVVITALTLGGICLHKGGKVLGKEAKLGEKLKQGWKELVGKGEKTVKEESLKDKKNPSKEPKAEEQKGEKPKAEEPKAEEQNNVTPKTEISEEAATEHVTESAGSNTTEEIRVINTNDSQIDTNFEKATLSTGDNIKYKGEDLKHVKEIENIDALNGDRIVNGEKCTQDVIIDYNENYNIKRTFEIGKNGKKGIREITYFGVDDSCISYDIYKDKNGNITRFISYWDDGQLREDTVPRRIRGGNELYYRNGNKIEETVDTIYNGSQRIIRNFFDEKDNLLRKESTVPGSRRKLDDVWYYKTGSDNNLIKDYSYHDFDIFNRPETKFIYDEEGNYKKAIDLEHKGFFNKILNFFDILLRPD